MSYNNGKSFRARIDDAQRRLPLPKLTLQLVDGCRAKKTACCPFHDDQNPSFATWRTGSGAWFLKCHAGCGQGDEITYLETKLELDRSEAMREYLKMAAA